MLNKAARSLSGRIIRSKNRTAAFTSNSRATNTLDELSKSIASLIGDSDRDNSLIAAALPLTFNSKSSRFNVDSTRPFASRTVAGIGTSVDSTLMTSLSFAGFAVGDGSGRRSSAGSSVGVYLTGALCEGFGVGVGFSGGLTRPDCAYAPTEQARIIGRANFI